MRIAAAFLWIVAALTGPVSAGTLEDIHARGMVTCAVPAALPGIAEAEGGKRTGLAIDLCSIFAAALLGRPGATAIVEVTTEDAALALQAEEADVLLMPRPWRFAQEVEEGVMLVQPLLHAPGKGAVFGPAVRQGDDAWFVAVRWLLKALQAGPGNIPDGARDLAVSGLGFSPDWTEKIFSTSNSYDDLLARHMKKTEAAGWQVVPIAAAAQF